jgi:iron complex transport system substrate-binding protein
MLGARDKIVSTSINYNNNQFLAKVFPTNISTPFDGHWTVNMEQLLIDDPQVVFIVDRSNLNLTDVPIVDPIQRANITYVLYYPADIAGWEQTVELVGTTLGGDAVNLANQYVDYVESQVTYVSNQISSIPESEHPRVLMINPTNMQIQGANTTQDAFITRAGGINAAANINGYENGASMEEIIAMNPDVIILLGTSEDKAQIMSDPQWAPLSAVQNDRVYVNPSGCSAWHSLAPECALETTWIAKMLYPTEFQSVNMVQETVDFYQTYFGITITEEDATSILNR